MTRQPTRDQLLSMAYVDGELADAARAEFERRLAQEPALRTEVAALRELELLARAAAPREPLDHEWEALSREPLQRGVLGLGWVLLCAGVLGGIVFAALELALSDEPLALKLVLAALAGGLALLFGAVLRARLRTQHLDPYRKVQR
ncbi:MAG: hypothetical protein EXS08_00765 [Planctomycetes bacterium]|nr:hypothetical protein [Planctomycetota bacterium]